jgi:hypothetical protein
MLGAYVLQRCLERTLCLYDFGGDGPCSWVCLSAYRSFFMLHKTSLHHCILVVNEKINKSRSHENPENCAALSV